jgi:hypothetical protein
METGRQSIPVCHVLLSTIPLHARFHQALTNRGHSKLQDRLYKEAMEKTVHSMSSVLLDAFI